MPVDKRYLFVSYAREDIKRVRPLVDAVAHQLASRFDSVDLWMDVSNLRPGERWASAIANALEASIGFLFFLSRRSLRSDWVHRELEAAASASGRLIIPVVLEEGLNLPPLLAERQWIEFVGHPTDKETWEAADQIAEATERFLRKTPRPRAPVTEAEIPALAADIAKSVRSSSEPASSESRPNSVFVVHGHDIEALTLLEEYLKKVGVMPIILARQDELPQSLFQKFMSVAVRARFAIVLLCADDYGAARRQYEAKGVADRALQFRARQNVILELGFFYGLLGWENVFVVYKGPDRVFPNFERPSDLDGVILDSISDIKWKEKLGEKLSAAGFDLLRA